MSLRSPHGRLGPRRSRRRTAFTLVELMIAIAIISTLVTIALPTYANALETARVTVATRDIEHLQSKIELYVMITGSLPRSLADIGEGDLLDPWGRPYQYLSFETIKGNGKAQQRKDRFLVPLNSRYDLYSLGADGKSQAPLTARTSRDDVVRANDGEFIGLASNY